MSLPKDGGDIGAPETEGSGLPREGSRDVKNDGKIIAIAWDWCNSPDDPVPYKIWAWQSDAANLVNSVRLTGDRPHTKDSIVRECYGDEAGVGGGVISGTHNGTCTPKTWSETVRFEGRNVVRHDDEWWMNDKNTWGKLQYTKDMGNYGLPKVPLIEPKMPGLGNGVGPGTQVAQAAGGVAAPAITGGVGEGIAGTLGTIGEAAPPVAIGTGAVVGTGGVSLGAAELYAAAHNAHMTILQGPDVSAPGAPTIDQIDKAYAKNQAQALAKAKVKPDSWVRITQNPCTKYACGVPGSTYRGGTYLCSRGPNTQSHHTPAASVSYLPYSAGPAIQMDAADHAQTASYGSTLGSSVYRAAQSSSISSGNFMGAVGMDVVDVKIKFGHKYDGAVAQMLLYANCLKQNGFVR